MAKKNVFKTSSSKKKTGKVWGTISLVLVFALGLGAAGTYAAKTTSDKNAEIDALKADFERLEKTVNENDKALKDAYLAGDENLTGKIESGDSVLSNQIVAGDNVLSDSISELEESIVWYQHEVRLTIKVESTETGGSAAALGYCGLTIINDNPNAYDCIDVGNGNNSLVNDLATIGTKNTSGYCLIDYRTYEGGKGRRLMYLFQNTIVFNDTTEGSVYEGNHLYVFVYSVYAEGDFATPNVQSQLIPNIIISYDPDGNPVYNGGRLILTDTAGIKTATIADTVTTISLK